LRSRITVIPAVTIVLGSGLGPFADKVENPTVINYSDIPGWPRSTAVGHAGKLVFGKVAGTDVAVLSGRAHFYEGYGIDKVVLGVRVLAKLGCRVFILTNAAGGVNLHLREGTLVLMSDHLNMQGVKPLTGPNDESLGPRFPDMTYTYSPAFRRIAYELALTQRIRLEQGVYAALPGPSYETPAEIRYLRSIGADLVGMSTVPEAIALNHMGASVLGISCVTNMAAGVTGNPLNHQEVIETGNRVRDEFIQLLTALIPKLAAAAKLPGAKL